MVTTPLPSTSLQAGSDTNPCWETLPEMAAPFASTNATYVGIKVSGLPDGPVAIGWNKKLPTTVEGTGVGPPGRLAQATLMYPPGVGVRVAVGGIVGVFVGVVVSGVWVGVKVYVGTKPTGVDVAVPHVVISCPPWHAGVGAGVPGPSAGPLSH